MNYHTVVIILPYRENKVTAKGLKLIYRENLTVQIQSCL